MFVAVELKAALLHTLVKAIIQNHYYYYRYLIPSFCVGDCGESCCDSDFLTAHPVARDRTRLYPKKEAGVYFRIPLQQQNWKFPSNLY